jgi:hypothetical protein
MLKRMPMAIENDSPTIDEMPKAMNGETKSVDSGL